MSHHEGRPSTLTRAPAIDPHPSIAPYRSSAHHFRDPIDFHDPTSPDCHPPASSPHGHPVGFSELRGGHVFLSRSIVTLGLNGAQGRNERERLTPRRSWHPLDENGVAPDKPPLLRVVVHPWCVVCAWSPPGVERPNAQIEPSYIRAQFWHNLTIVANLSPRLLHVWACCAPRAQERRSFHSLRKIPQDASWWRFMSDHIMGKRWYVLAQVGD